MMGDDEKQAPVGASFWRSFVITPTGLSGGLRMESVKVS